MYRLDYFIIYTSKAMKNIIYLFVLLFTAFTVSCDDSFLEENKKQIDGYDLLCIILIY